MVEGLERIGNRERLGLTVSTELFVVVVVILFYFLVVFVIH